MATILFNLDYSKITEEMHRAYAAITKLAHAATKDQLLAALMRAVLDRELAPYISDRNVVELVVDRQLANMSALEQLLSAVTGDETLRGESSGTQS